MDAAGLRALCLSFPGAYEDFPFGPEHSVFKVEKKLFAISALGASPLKVSLKCEPELAEQLRASYPDCVAPGYHLNKRHWNTVTLRRNADRRDGARHGGGLVRPDRGGDAAGGAREAGLGGERLTSPDTVVVVALRVTTPRP